MKSAAILYVPSDTPEAMVLSTRFIAGVPLIIRGLMTLAGTGIGRVTLLVAKSQREPMEAFLTRYSKQRLPGIDILVYDEPYRLSPKLVAKLLDLVDERFFFINANLLFDKEFFKAIKSFSARGPEMVVCHDGAHPLPFFAVTKASLKLLIPFTTEEPRSMESSINYLLSELHHHQVQKPAKAQTFLLTDLRHRAVAEKFLTEMIRLATGGPIARFLNKRISLPISMVLSKLWISPNAITCFNMLLGALSGVLIADGKDYFIILMGATLFQMASVIDGCDGEVAKLTFRSTKFGEYIDTISDNLSLVSLLAGIIGGSWRHSHSEVGFIVGGIWVVLTLIVLGLIITMLRRYSDSGSLAVFEREILEQYYRVAHPVVRWFISFGRYLLKKDVMSFSVFAFALFGVMYWWLYAAVIVTAFGAVILTMMSIRDSRMPLSERHEILHAHQAPKTS
ncbi:MAG: CDP-alcohol phosphatidyltransferase family protein [Deltaproteobacteria bacterium]|nr:CDP-alcohol phosphatidyltransferase family protein [Deltaproteobacteria bacterium]